MKRPRRIIVRPCFSVGLGEVSLVGNGRSNRKRPCVKVRRPNEMECWTMLLNEVLVDRGLH